MARSSAPALIARGFAVLERAPPKAFKGLNRLAAASREPAMRRDDEGAPLVERPGGKGGKCLIARMMSYRRQTSPIRLRSLPIASRSRDFTVPSGSSRHWRARRGLRRQNESFTTAIAPAGSSCIAARTRFSHSAMSKEPSGPLSAVIVCADSVKCEGLGALIAAQPVDPEIARDRIDPSRGAGPRRIELRGLAPNCQQRVLRDILAGSAPAPMRSSMALIAAQRTQTKQRRPPDRRAPQSRRSIAQAAARFPSDFPPERRRRDHAFVFRGR